MKNNNNVKYLNRMHVLNSWFILKKIEINDSFISDWVYYSKYKDDTFKDALVTYHHTGDQGIFNILVLKYNLPVFYCELIYHDMNKDKNLVLEVINNTENTDEYFIYLR